MEHNGRKNLQLTFFISLSNLTCRSRLQSKMITTGHAITHSCHIMLLQYGQLSIKSWSHHYSLKLRFNSLCYTSWKIMAETLRYNLVPEVNQQSAMNRIQFLLWLFPLSLLGQVPHSPLYVAISGHADYQISMTENSRFNFFFRGSSLKTLIIFLKSFFSKSVFKRS